MIDCFKTHRHPCEPCTWNFACGSQILAYDNQGSPRGFGSLRYLFSDIGNGLQSGRFVALGYRGAGNTDGSGGIGGPEWSLGTGLDGDGHLAVGRPVELSK